MKRDLNTLLADTLFNTNLRPDTRKSVLLAALKQLKVNENVFTEALEKESANPVNVKKDQRERDRNPVDGQLGLEEKELRLLQGKGLSDPS